jgi:hypothetical protein
MSYTFPKNQEDGKKIKLANGVTYVYDASKKSWEIMTPEQEEAPELFTLSSAGNNFYFINNGSEPPYTNQFTCAQTSTRYNIEWHIYNMFDNKGAMVWVRDYVATPATVWEIYAASTNPELRVKTTIKNWQTSNRSDTRIMFNASGPSPSAYDGVNLAHNGKYCVSLSKLRKK